MILEKLVVKPYETNCYIIGSANKKEVYIIDPGGEAKKIINKLNILNCRPIGIILTHTHPDHTKALKPLMRQYSIPLWYNKKEFEYFKIFKWMKADTWLSEGDILKINGIHLHVMETAGHSPGSISLYTKDIKTFENKDYDGIVFTGDLIFRRDKGRSDLAGGNEELLCSNIRNKLIYNPKLSDNFLILAGHLEPTTIGEEKKYNPFKERFC